MTVPGSAGGAARDRQSEPGRAFENRTHTGEEKNGDNDRAVNTVLLLVTSSTCIIHGGRYGYVRKTTNISSRWFVPAGTRKQKKRARATKQKYNTSIREE